ncbi:MAG: hypothetical protein DMF06_06225 [Verrucomicrobia bacterium]|nr:MAG: hypothetical protein DMF06_06225 [Verrucomicrobiota bacterium]
MAAEIRIPKFEARNKFKSPRRGNDQNSELLFQTFALGHLVIVSNFLRVGSSFPSWTWERIDRGS